MQNAEIAASQPVALCLRRKRIDGWSFRLPGDPGSHPRAHRRGASGAQGSLILRERTRAPVQRRGMTVNRALRELTDAGAHARPRALALCYVAPLATNPTLVEIRSIADEIRRSGASAFEHRACCSIFAHGGQPHASPRPAAGGRPGFSPCLLHLGTSSRCWYEERWVNPALAPPTISRRDFTRARRTNISCASPRSARRVPHRHHRAERRLARIWICPSRRAGLLLHRRTWS